MIKDFFKQKKVMALIGCVVGAIVVTLFGMYGNSKVDVIVQMERALNENDKYAYIDCFLPEDQEEAEIAYGLMNLDEMYGELSDEEVDYTFEFMQGERTEVNSYESTVEVVIAIYDGNECIGIDSVTMIIIEEDGREYIEG